MEALKRKRGVIRGLVTKHVNRIDELIDTNNLIELEAILTLLQVKAGELESLNNEIEPLLDDSDSLEEELETVEAYNEKICICRVKAGRVLEGGTNTGRVLEGGTNTGQVDASHGSTSNVSAITQPAVVPKVKLPKLQIGKFSGDTDKWQRFWDQFYSAVDQNSSLSEIDKFGYLCSLLSDRAAAAIDGLAMTKDNYAIAIQILQERFGKKEKIIRAHMQGLWDLPPRRDTVELESLRALVDNCLTRIRSLEALGIDMSVQGTLLCHVILRAVPQKIHLRWRESLTAGQQVDDLNELMNFLLKQVENLELTADVPSERPLSKTVQKVQKLPGFSQDQGVATTSALKLEVEAGLEQNKMSCFFCENPSHRAHECPDYVEVNARKQRIRQLGRCYVCLKGKHTAQVCWQRNRCRKCRGRHHHLLCEAHSRSNEQRQPVLESAVTVAGAQIRVEASKPGTVLLQTATILVRSPSTQLLAKCLFDGGSQKTFVRTALVNQLNVKPQGKENLVIRGFGQVTGQTAGCHRVPLWLEERHGQVGIEVEALQVPEIGVIAKSHGLGSWKRHMQQRGLSLADNYDSQNNQAIDILIGADYYWRLISGRMVRLTDGLVAVESIFGWVLQGPLEEASTLMTEVQALHVAIREDLHHDLDTQVKKMWDLDTIGITDRHDVKTALSKNDRQVLDKFEDTIKYNGQRYTVRLPWKENSEQLTSNKSQAKKRLNQLIHRLRRNDDLRTRYSDAMATYKELGHAELAQSQENAEHIYYMPHHAVIREDRVSTKLRVVFDASSKEPGTLSLNDCLHIGPSLNPEIVALLLRFRRHAVAIVGDIEKAFLQVELATEDRDAVRLLWIQSDWDGKGPVTQVEWRMTRVVFGAGPGPFLLAATVKHHAKKYSREFPVASKALDEDLFVDDLLTGASSSAAAYTLYKEVKEILGCAGMPLKKWVSSSDKVRRLWTDTNESQYPFSKEISDSASLKVLGLWWDSILDVFRYDPGPLLTFLTNQSKVSKRLVLQASARLFDPLGLVCPVLIDVKILFQDLWIRGIGWDDDIPIELQQRWGRWMDSLPGLSCLKIPRWYNFMPEDDLQIHVFADSSERAYGSVIFVRITKRGTEDIMTRLVIAKARVAPVKRVSLPRLELLGALTAARLCTYFKEALRLPNVPTYFWTDSAIALQWIHSPSAHWKTFVANRVQEIQNLSDPGMWKHCPSAQNPADLVTKGCYAEDLGKSKLWWEGPEWLKQDPKEWPAAQKLDGNCTQLAQNERRKSDALVLVSFAREELFDLKRFSSWQRVLRITAWIRRAFRNIDHAESSLTAQEISQAAIYWIKHVQQVEFAEEVARLRMGQVVLQSSKIYQLNPFLDEDSLLRAKGRLQLASVAEETRHPVILPSSHRITELIVIQKHASLMHSGVQATLAGLRTRFWIPRGRQIVKRILRSCPVCCRYLCRPGQQVEAPLPIDRISEARPFEVSGLDYAGPLFVKVGDKLEKAYIVLFTCAVTRALHLELVVGMSTEHFILALRRFFSRRGICKILYSDNARTFKRADLELQELSKVIGHADVTSFCGNNFVTWKYIVERAAWWGGFWERLVRSVKTCLRKILRNSCLHFEEMSTVLAEVEAVVNSRPLTYTYADLDEGEALTPSHFLIGELLTTLPVPERHVRENVSTKHELTRRWKHRGRLMNTFWKRWSKEYLMDLRTAWETKNLDATNVIKPGILVLVHDERLPKHRWKLGRVEEVLEGRDGRVRSCMIKIAGGQRLKRPVQLLSPLEL